MKRQKYTVCACNMFSQVIYCSSAQNSEESSAGACSFCGFHALHRLANRMLASHWPSRFSAACTSGHCSMPAGLPPTKRFRPQLRFLLHLYTYISYNFVFSYNYNRTIQRGITLLHHKAVFTNPCYYATLATMPLSLGPKGWHSIEV